MEHELMGQIAVIDAVVDGCPFYILNGNLSCSCWTEQAEKVKKLWISKHRIRYAIMWILNALGGGIL
jgi:hypothetical protein